MVGAGDAVPRRGAQVLPKQSRPGCARRHLAMVRCSSPPAALSALRCASTMATAAALAAALAAGEEPGGSSATAAAAAAAFWPSRIAARRKRRGSGAIEGPSGAQRRAAGEGAGAG